MKATFVTVLILISAKFGVSQNCENKLIFYKQYSLCTGIFLQFPSNISVTRALQCEKCNIPTFNDDTLKSFKGDIINVTNGQIHTLESTAFKGFWPSVRQFWFPNNNISTIALGIFNKFNSIQKLILTNNKIDKLSRNQFDNVTVHTLDLSMNNLSDLHGVFDGIKLSKLNLSFNSLTDIPEDCFKYTKLYKDYSSEQESLYLNDNKIRELHAGSFRFFSGSLRLINLNNNFIKDITNSTFTNVPDLQNLYISNNSIRALQWNAFLNLKMLNLLDLSHNSLEDIPMGLFKDLRNLRTLNLSKNKIRELPNIAFSGLINLVTLDVSGNLLKTLSYDTLFPLGKLSTIDVSRNKLQYLDLEKIISHHASLRTWKIEENFWLCSNLVKMYRLMNQKYGAFFSPSGHFNVPNLHGIACSRVTFEVTDDMTFDDFLSLISKDMALEGLYEVNVDDQDNVVQVLEYLKSIYFVQSVTATVIVLFLCILMCLCVSSYFQKNNMAQHLKLFYNSRGDNVELLK